MDKGKNREEIRRSQKIKDNNGGSGDDDDSSSDEESDRRDI